MHTEQNIYKQTHTHITNVYSRLVYTEYTEWWERFYTTFSLPCHIIDSFSRYANYFTYRWKIYYSTSVPMGSIMYIFIYIYSIVHEANAKAKIAHIEVPPKKNQMLDFANFLALISENMHIKISSIIIQMRLSGARIDRFCRMGIVLNQHGWIQNRMVLSWFFV